jgi:hypothetical protein
MKFLGIGALHERHPDPGDRKTDPPQGANGPLQLRRGVIREALRLLDERDQLTELHKNEIRKKIAAGMASLLAGKGADGEAVFDRIDAKLDAAARRGQG